MYNPKTTYRIQFNKDFTFKSLNKIIPYLKKLGVDTIYASPIFEAVPGSTHGYDVTNPLTINPEIGTEEELLAISTTLKEAGMQWLQDIVPNHMAYHPNNAWLMDVLEKGSASEFATFFDIDFSTGQKIMVPFLGSDLDDAINDSLVEIKEISARYYLSYAESNWPLSESSKAQLAGRKLEEVNSDKRLIKKIADEQHYRLCNWKETDSQINYRRFFTVNGLICLNIQHQDAFDRYHEYIFKLVKQGVFQGLRIDHIDGLFDPKEYLDRLYNEVGEDIYVVVEKILESDEEMPERWRTQGSTGYDFLAIMNNLFTNRAAKSAFNKIYKKVIGKKLDPPAMIHEKKTAILFDHMQGELDNLVDLFSKLKLAEEMAPDRQLLKKGIGEMMVQMPVYRYYNYNFPLNGDALKNVKSLLKPVVDNAELSAVGELLWQIFIENPLTKNEEYNQRLTQFFLRCMQFTGPLMAKGVEDTLMFTYNRFVGHTEVGDAPDAFGLTVTEFHQKMVDRQQHWPLALNGSATHDTKKGEDVRARLNTLTDIPKEWEQMVTRLITLTSKLKSKDKSFAWLHDNDVYLIFQTILGAMPMPGEPEDDLQSRLELYIEKALREAKKRSGWAEPNEEYEILVKDFANELLNSEAKSYQALNKFSTRIADFGIVNSLAQVLLKFTCPGIPDLYQGSELWDLSLVDPDNRRPVDYTKREEFLSEIESEKSLKKIWDERYSGKAKLWLTHKLLGVRKTHESIFENGEYIPLKVKGTYAKNVCAYIRKLNDICLLVAVPLGMAGISKNNELSDFDWLDTEIILPSGVPASWQNLLTEKAGTRDFLNDGISIGQVFSEIPLGLLQMKSAEDNRSAGILMHITSLPSEYGIGDFGKPAYQFIDFLTAAGQQYWQILPLNPTKSTNGHSPYSSNSAMAGNYLLISPEELLRDGLLNASDVDKFKVENSGRIDFEKTEKSKSKLLSKAYKHFSKSADHILAEGYSTFCEQESYWLNDFALYATIKQHLKSSAWYHWPTELKTREPEALAKFAKEHAEEIDEIKWQQFVFYRQWLALKDYANKNSVKIIGDLPFYLDYDSVEVWANPELFSLDEELNVKTVAGVPPDYFNDKGQLWGMPVFNWANMKATNYDWWIKRLKKNLELFDLLRLDHFRAFSSYWAVAAEEQDAVNGSWQQGPGADFFNELKKQLGSLPFIAEDLGEITSDVEELRDQFNLPGMKVLQFAFGEDMPSSPHIPYRYRTPNAIVYSGTHDNNTVVGWYNTEIDKRTKQRIKLYTGVSVGHKNIHEVMLRLAYGSNAFIAILPIQDVLGLDESARMNVPGNANGNWNWRMDDDAVTSKIAKLLSAQTAIYGRSR